MMRFAFSLNIHLVYIEGDINGVTGAAETDALTFGGFIALMMGLAYLFFRIVIPAYAKRIANKQAIESLRSEDRLKQDRSEEALSDVARTFLAENAQYTFNSIRRLVEDCNSELDDIRKKYQEILIEASELRTTISITEEENARLKSDIVTSKNDLHWTKSALDDAQTEMVKMQAQLTILEHEIKSAQKRLVAHRDDASKLKERVEALESELRDKTTEGIQQESEIAALQKDALELSDKVKELQTQNIALKRKVWQNSIGNNSDGIETSELLVGTVKPDKTRDNVSSDEPSIPDANKKDESDS